MNFREERGIGYCGLACVLCSDKDCPGCAAKIANGGGCSAGKCTAAKNLDGCYACTDYDSCTENMPHGKRSRAFIRYAKEFGKQALIDRLRLNHENGIIYHKPDGSTGDYDALPSEEDILRLLRFGSHSPYIKCPTLEGERFTIRLIRLDDAEELLRCYSDPQAHEIINSDYCTSDFRYQSAEEMLVCIKDWLKAYQKQEFVRFSIVDKYLNQAVGTVEMFGMIGVYKTPRGVLRIDIGSEYENQECLCELLTLCVSSFHNLFDVECIVSKAIPAAKERIAAMHASGLELYDWPGREHYWAHMVN